VDEFVDDEEVDLYLVGCDESLPLVVFDPE